MSEHGATVITRDFGKADREHARKLATLIGELEAHQDDVLKNPGKYLKEASDRMLELLTQVRAAQDALLEVVSWKFDDGAELHTMEVVTVDKRRWDRMQRATDLLEAIKT